MKNCFSLALAFTLTTALAIGSAPLAAQTTDIESLSRVMRRASDAVVGLRATAVDGARSASTLGPQRSGSGVVIGEDGLVLTIGYLVLEAEQVLLLTDDGRELPARVVAYDVATGFGLVQALAPIKLEPAPLGNSAALTGEEPLMMASGGAQGAVSIARMVSRRAFSGYWEYHIDGALFTTPPRPDHSGAGLFNGRGELVGIGSLFVTESLGRGAPRVPGNMFVPIDLLAPIVAELRARGASRASERAWIGINGVETDEGIRVARVSTDSPADVAGLQAGDRIRSIDGTEISTLEALWKALWSGGSAEREVALEVMRSGERKTFKVQTVDRMKTLKRAEGV